MIRENFSDYTPEEIELIANNYSKLRAISQMGRKYDGIDWDRIIIALVDYVTARKALKINPNRITWGDFVKIAEWLNRSKQ